MDLERERGAVVIESMNKPGDVITVVIRGSKIPPLKAIVPEVRPDVVYYRYADDAPVFGGLCGMLSLPRTASASGERAGSSSRGTPVRRRSASVTSLQPFLRAGKLNCRKRS